VAYERKGNIDKAIEAYKDAILLRLDYVKAHLQLAPLLQRKGALEEAIVHYQHASNLDHTLVDASITAARLLCQQERFLESLPYFNRALQAKPDDSTLKFEYANTLTTCNRNEQALELYYELLKVRPHDAVVLYNTAFTLKKLGRITDAMPYYQAALARNPNHTEAHFSLGLAHLALGNFNEGWPLYEYRWKRNAQLAPRNFSKPQWDGSPLEGKTLLIHAEQGLGDTFQFIRYVREVKEQYNCSIIFAAQGPLHTIVSRCCPYIDRVVTLSSIPTSFDLHIPLMSLPLIFNTEENTIPTRIPYIFPDDGLIEHWKQLLAQDENIKVGICFQGNSKYSTAQLRAAVASKSLPVHTFAPLLQLEGVSIYCLQKETGTDQLSQISPQFNLRRFDETFDTTNGRFMDTAAVIKNLDLVITIDTSIAHLSGAIGTPTWIILPEPADWRWMLKRSDTPWYPQNVRLFRQPKTGDWNSVMQTIKEELQIFVANKQNLSTITPPTQQDDTMKELFKLRANAMKNIDPNNTETFVHELKRAHQLYKLQKLMLQMSQEAA
jgi:tetratricopeptide (TPR) repeat protein